MRRTVLRILITLAATLALSAGAPASAAPAGAAGTPPAAAASPAPVAAPRTARSVDVHLITGDQVLLSHERGKPRLTILLRTHIGIAGQYTTFSMGGDIYVFPGAARRYLGTVLDPSLFDVTQLARSASNGRLPVTVGLSRGAHVPGLTVTARTATSARGYLTARGRRAFGAALARQWRRDARTGRTTTSLFGGVRRIAVTGTAHPAAARPVVGAAPVVSGTATGVRPDFQQYTLVLKVRGPAGRPAGAGLIFLTNTDNPRKYQGLVVYQHGTAKVSLPAGHYTAMAELDRFHGLGVDSYLMFRDRFAVTHNKTRVGFDSRTATVRPSVTTPHPARVQSESFDWERRFRFASIDVGSELGLDSTVHVTPERTVARGALHWLTSYQLVGDPSDGSSYTYDLEFVSTGSVPADQRHVVTPSDVAEIDARYFTDAQTRESDFGRGATLPFEVVGLTLLWPTPTPLVRTEYISGPPDAAWQATLVAAPSDRDPFQGSVLDALRAYRPGTVERVDWLGGLLAPGLPAPAEYGCSFCRYEGELALAFTPYSDTDPSHDSSLDLLGPHQIATRFALFRNGRPIVREVNGTGAFVPVPAAAANYRAVVRSRRVIAGFATATYAQVVVTFRSSATSGKTAPKSLMCPCTVLPVVTATVPLPTGLDDTMPTGRSTVVFQVQHATGAADLPMKRVTFALSGTDGRGFTRVPVTALGGHRYQAVLTNPARWANHGVAVRITATDSAGNTLKETVDNAYYVA